MAASAPTTTTPSPQPLPSPDLSERARAIVAENAAASKSLFASTAAETTPPAELAACRLRRGVQFSHGPFAAPKRARHSPSDQALVPTTQAGDAHHVKLPHIRASTVPLSTAQPPPSTALVTATPAALTTRRKRAARIAQEKPEWHAPWRVYRVMSGHLGWVRSIAFDTSNEWFATGSADRTIKIWDSATGGLRLTLTGHIAAVRALAVSDRHPYLFSVGEDKTVKCWDLEHNRVVRNYHGHLSGVYCAALHPTLDVLMTGGRDSTVRVWDIRSRAQALMLAGHRDTVNAVVTRAVDPQVVSASADSTIRLWDLAAGRCQAVLTHHKRGVRALALHSRLQSFASASADNIKSWGLPQGTFARNFGDAHDGGLVNALAVNDDGVLVSGGDDGRVRFWDYHTARRFDEHSQAVQPGSLECEAGVFALEFDRSGSRLVSAETDKTVRMWKEDESATQLTHPAE